MDSAVPDGPDRSPPLLSPPPRRGRGVRRLNRVPVLIFVGGAMLVVAAVGYTYRERMAQAAANVRAADQKRPEPASSAAVLNAAPANGEVQAAVYRPPSLPPTRQHSPPQTQAAAAPSDHGGAEATRPDEDATKARQQAWQTYYAQVAQVQKARLSAAQSAMTSDTGLTNGQQSASNPGSPAATGGAGAGQTGAMPGSPTGYAGAPVVAGGYGSGLPVYPPAQVDAPGQREKQAFLAQPGDTTGASDDLQATLREPSSPYLVMAGTAIPAVMVGGINSDMPGMIVGQVAENVYDTATGHYLLIPQGAKLIGRYDNSVSMGQTRVGVIWTRIIYPDGESIDLGSMEGTDQGGYAGFHDLVDTHFWSKIGNALLISVAGAGVQLSQPQAVNGQNYNSQQIAAAALGQQFGELGQEYARAGLSIPNTLEIRPGYRFVVMVNKDMHLRPYADLRTTSSSLPVSLGPIVR
ncbi:MAG TPA: TrbI/VirB10 family protein [Acetobacteraceae bacterium]|nr:TrbI/VirB10 family protein [Acetobacteraceae bacterium]